MGPTDQPAAAVVCDAGPLIHLDVTGCLDLLNDFAEVLVPAAVEDEVQRHRPKALEKLSGRVRIVSPALPEPPTSKR